MPKSPTPDQLVTETEFLKTTVATLRYAGYQLVFHVIDAKAHAKVTSTGFPDIFAIHPQRGILVAELKSQRGRVTTAQYDWLDHLRLHLPPPDNPYASARAHLWRPADADAVDTQAGVANAPTRCTCPVCEANRLAQPIARAKPDRPRYQVLPNSPY